MSARATRRSTNTISSTSCCRKRRWLHHPTIATGSRRSCWHRGARRVSSRVTPSPRCTCWRRISRCRRVSGARVGASLLPSKPKATSRAAFGRTSARMPDRKPIASRCSAPRRPTSNRSFCSRPIAIARSRTWWLKRHRQSPTRQRSSTASASASGPRATCPVSRFPMVRYTSPMGTIATRRRAPTRRRTEGRTASWR